VVVIALLTFLLLFIYVAVTLLFALGVILFCTTQKRFQAYMYVAGEVQYRRAETFAVVLSHYPECKRERMGSVLVGEGYNMTFMEEEKKKNMNT
jgi:hypothetical protein